MSALSMVAPLQTICVPGGLKSSYRFYEWLTLGNELEISLVSYFLIADYLVIISKFLSSEHFFEVWKQEKILRG